MAAGEFAFIDWLRKIPAVHPTVILGPGDDTAILHRPERELLLTTDMLMDGVDFHLHKVCPRAIGEKAMAVNLSDIAAMAGEPLAALVALALPTSTTTAARTIAEELFLGIRDFANRYGVAIVGGENQAWTPA